MALQISKNSDLSDIVSDENPITSTHPTTGSTQEVQVWIFNDDSTRTYKSITIQPTDVVSTDESSWISLALDDSGSAATYESPAAPISITDIETDNIGTSFWVKITTPSGQTVQNKNDIKLTVSYTEYAV